MVELVLFLVAFAIGAGIGKMMNHLGARGALPTLLQRSYDRNERAEAARREPVVVDRDRDPVRV